LKKHGIHECPFQQKTWRGAITKEDTKMTENKVIQLILQSMMEPGRECIKCKWVFEIKRDGTFQACLVACGYSQIPGVDFQESYSPVTNDVVFRIVIIYQIIFGYVAVLVDVEVALLNRELEETIYMEVPPGMKKTGDQVCLLEW
jgi:Reverse transcriptase (RNA-dependent DNA polymerase)